MILNFTQHPATAEQLAAGVIDLKGADLSTLKAALTFDELPTQAVIAERAMEIVRLAKNALFGQVDRKVMIGGAPFFMAALEFYLKAAGLQPVYSFSKRVSVEKTLPDGTVQKVNAFRHEGFIEA